MMHKLASALILDSDLSELRLLIERHAGVLIDEPSESLRASLVEYAESAHVSTGAELVALFSSSDSHRDELLEMFLPGETSFCRYPTVFDTLRKHILPAIEHNSEGDGPRPLRILSAGCSTGEEPYSIALSLCEALQGTGAGWSVHIIAGDIRRRALAIAERGLYQEPLLQKLPRTWLSTYFSRVGDHFLIKPRVRNLVTFAPMNLTQANFIGRFDCIFCMDVLSRFSSSQRNSLLKRLYMFLEPGGYLLVGDCERLSPEGFQSESYLDCTYYRRPMAAAARSAR